MLDLHLHNLIQIAGLLHLSLLLAGASAAHVLQWRTELYKLSTLSRQMIWVHGIFIVLTILGFAAVSLTQSHALAAGTTIARCVTGFIAFFWTARLFIQFFVFDAREFLTTPWRKLGYHALTVVFTYFAVIYTYAAVHGMGGA